MIRQASPIALLSLAALAMWFCSSVELLSADGAGSLATYDTPADAQADPDFALQGEYQGDKLGVQVVALGDGNFSVVSYGGGLPGAGFDGKQKQELEADREDVIETVAGLKKVKRKSPTLDAKPPAGAIALFDGSRESLEKYWQPGAKLTADGLLAQGCSTAGTFRDFTLHVEFRLPYMPAARGQGRGNSGIYYQGRYETQVLDSFGLKGENNECGGIYTVRAPDVNMCLPPLAWQTYDVDFTAARWNAEGQKTADARLTVRLNGVLVQPDVPVPGPTTAAPVAESPEPGPIYLQDHGNPVRYRNIWLAPRDVDREARRPIVPGFERFYATAGADHVSGGRLLLGELGCTACHAAEPALADHLAPRPAPMLDKIGGRVRPEWLLEFLAHPRQTKPGTTMPDLLAGMSDAERAAKARALVSFLYPTGSLREARGNRQFAQHGEQLFQQVGCVACHDWPAGKAPPLAAAGAARPPLSGAGDSLPLPNLTEKYSIPSLAEFLQDPSHARPAGRMPSLNLNHDEARDLANYLVGDADVRPKRPNLSFAVYEGSWAKLPDFDELQPAKRGEVAGLDLTVAERTSNFGVRFTGFFHVPRAGDYIFHLGSDDGSRLAIDGRTIVDNDGVHPHSVSSGKATLGKGPHAIRVDYMQGGGEWTLELEYEGPGVSRQLADLAMWLTETSPAPQSPADDDDLFVFEPSQVPQGRELFVSLGCAACHQLQHEAQPLKAARIARALKDCRLDRGCLAPTAQIDGPADHTVATPAAPDFGLTAVQTEALSAALAVQAPAGPPSAAERVAHTMTALNCQACHVRGGVGGPTAERNPLFITTIPEMGDEGRLPPPLDGVGDKLADGWLRHVLGNGAKDRPYMLTRMPRFSSPEVAALADAFIAIDRRTEATVPKPTEPLSRVKSTGRFLAGDKALACVKCHTFGEHRATGIQALNLLTMTARVREDWFHRYLLDPSKYRPGTRMPSGFVGGHSTITSVYEGDPARQIGAIWAYLSDGDRAGIPDGLIADVIELKPETTPIIYRNFIEGLSPRGIAVGYPEHANLAWDADKFSLALVWHGRFIDASKHWTGRGNGNQTPLGDHVIRLDSTAPLAILDSVETNWPAVPPKEQGYRFGGYRLDRQGRPTFRYTGPGFSVEDKPLPVAAADDPYFERHMVVRAERPLARLYFRAGAASDIRPLADGSYLVGDSLKIRLRAGVGEAIVRAAAGGKELLAPVNFENGRAEIIEEIRW
jgi:cytochrome c2